MDGGSAESGDFGVLVRGGSFCSTVLATFPSCHQSLPSKALIGKVCLYHAPAVLHGSFP